MIANLYDVASAEALATSLDEATTDTTKADMLASRKGFISASEVWKLFTEAKKKGEVSETKKGYLLHKALQRLGFDAPTFRGNADTQWGNDNEAAAIEEYSKQFLYNSSYYDIKYPCEFMKRDEWIGCTPDAIVTHPQFGRSLVQVKCPAKADNHFELLAYKTPEDLKENSKNYYFQCQFEMYVTGIEYCDFVSYAPFFPEKSRLHMIHLEKDVEIFEKFDKVIELAKIEITRLMQELSE